MPMRLPGPLVLAGCTAFIGCAGAQSEPAPPLFSPSPSASATVPVPSTVGPTEGSADGAPTTCGALNCRLFATPAEAFSTVLALDPLVIAVGESHAKKGTEGIASCTSRFTNELLPLLEGKASDLVLELWVADGSCGKQEQQVAEEQKPVTTNQRETNQNEFVALGNRANELQIRPHVLRPSCEEYERIVAAGPDGVTQMLTMIAQMTDRMLQAILARNARDGKEKVVLAYGGAMHNDLHPREGREQFSFGPAQFAHTGGRYVEVDLIVPEFIGDSEVWRALPWYEHFDPTAHPDRVTLFEVQPGSYVLIFAATSRPDAAAAK